MITEFLLYALIAEKEAAMSTGHRIKIPNVTKNKKGEMEFDAPKKKKTLQQRYAEKKKQSFKKGKRI